MEQHERKKIGLVVEGGGMKCAYSAGILDRFLDENINFDYCIGVSAGSASIASYQAGQRDRNRRFYTEHLKDPNFFGFKSFVKSGDVFGIRYIYGPMTEEGGIDPLDQEALLANPSRLVIVATDAQTGQPHYFEKEEMPKNDYRIVMASCAIPAICKPVEVNGRLYYDGGISDAIPVAHAFADGCDKLVVISTKPRDYVKNPEKHRGMYHFLCRKYPKAIECMDNRHIMYRKCQDAIFAAEEEGKLFLMAPTREMKMGTYTMDGEANQKLYDLGVADYDAVAEELKAFLQE